MMPPMTSPPVPSARAEPAGAGRWADTLQRLRDRFREERLSVVAGSLTLTTLVSLVPLVTVMLALFSAFPMFAQLQDALQRFLVQSVVPDVIARPVLGAVTQFAAKANRLGVVGLLAFVVTAIALMLTIDRALNAIWRVPRPRPLTQRVLVYWAAITLGPLLLGASVWVTTTALGPTRGWLDDWPHGVAQTVAALLLAGEFALLAAGFAALYRLVPNAPVRWSHAAVGGLVAAAGFVLAKKGLALYLKAVPTFSVVYGAFATVPILLTWVYLAWMIVLLGAVVSACLPGVLSGAMRRPVVHGLDARLSLQVLSMLDVARRGDAHGVTVSRAAHDLRTDAAQLHPVLADLVALGWVGRLDEAGEPRFVLLADPASTALGPWFDRLLLVPSEGTGELRAALAPDRLRLADVLPAVAPARPRR